MKKIIEELSLTQRPFILISFDEKLNPSMSFGCINKRDAIFAMTVFLNSLLNDFGVKAQEGNKNEPESTITA